MLRGPVRLKNKHFQLSIRGLLHTKIPDVTNGKKIYNVSDIQIVLCYTLTCCVMPFLTFKNFYN